MVFFYSVGVVAVIFSAVGIFFLTRKRIAAPSFRRFFIFSVLFSLYLPVAQWFKYQSLHFYIDFAAWPELLQKISTSGYPISSIQGFLLGQSQVYNWLAVHFTPFLYVLALPFKLAPYPETIMVLNAIVMLSSIIPLYKLARLGREDRRFAYFVAVLFLWYPTFQYITLYGFEMLRFSIPILLWMVYFWERGRVSWYFIFAVLAILIREDVGLTVGMFGLYVLFFTKEKSKGFFTCVLGFGSVLFITNFVMPFFSSTPESNFILSRLVDHYGNTTLEIVKNMILQGGAPGSGWLNPVKWANIVMLFLPFLFIPFLASGLLLGTLASLGIGLISFTITHISYMLYYVSPAVPFILYAFIKGWPKLVRRLERIFPSPFIEEALRTAVLAGMVVSNIWFGPSPISLQFWSRDLRPAPFHTQDFHWSGYLITDHHRNINKFVSLIPDEAIVSAQEFAHPRLFKKKGIMLFPRLESDGGRVQADYVLLDITNNGLSSKSPIVYLITEETFAGVINNPTVWKLINSDGEYFLYKRVDERI